MNLGRFKPEIFFTLPICAFIISLVCASLITDQWVTGKATLEDEDGSSGEIKYNYGLFRGEKEVKIPSSTNTFSLRRKRNRLDSYQIDFYLLLL